MADETTTIRTDDHGPVRVITIDRPHVRNAVDRPTAAALHDACAAADADDAVRAIVLTGADGVFCAGADLHSVADDRGPQVHLDMSRQGPMGPTRMTVTTPTIAAVEGYAVAGGLELAMWCDLRVAADDAVFGVFCRRWGVPLVDGGTVRLTRMIGQSHALDLILTGRGVSGEEARMMGVVNRLCAPGDAIAVAVELGTQLAGFPQRCMRSDRQSAYEQWDLDIGEAMANETRLGREVIDSGETRDGAARFAAGAGRHGSPAE